MPVVANEAEPKRRRTRLGLLLALLLAPPLVFAALLISASSRPLEVGPFVVMTTARAVRIPRRAPWSHFGSFASRSPIPAYVTMEQGRFLVTSQIQVTTLRLGDFTFGLRWFKGKPAPISPEILNASREFNRPGAPRPSTQPVRK
jgi:hypothetical protein